MESKLMSRFKKKRLAFGIVSTALAVILIGGGAAAAMAASGQPSQHVTPLLVPQRNAPMSPAAALAAARSHAIESGGVTLSRASAASLPAKVKSMTMAEFDALAGVAASPLFASDRPVQVVSVVGHMAMDARPGQTPNVRDVYTEVYDAQTGSLLIQAIGYDFVK